MKRFSIFLLIFSFMTSTAFAARSRGGDSRHRDRDSSYSERSLSRSSSDDFNLRVGALALLAGIVNANLDVAVNREWTLGPELTFANLKFGASSNGFTNGYEISVLGFGARANWFKDGFHNDGLYVGPSLNYFTMKLTATDSSGSVTGEASGTTLGCLVGYAWFWENFNQMLGAGGTVGIGNRTIKVTTSAGTVKEATDPFSGGFALEYSLGWTF